MQEHTDPKQFRYQNESKSSESAFRHSKPVTSNLGESSSLTKKRIIAVADGGPAEHIKNALSGEYILVVTESVDEALNFLKKYNPSEEPCNLVIYSQIDGQMDPISFSEKVKSIDKNLPVVCLDNLAFPLTEADKKALGNRVFPKSFNSADLLLYVSGLLPNPIEGSSEPELNSDELSEVRKHSRILIVDDDEIIGRVCLRALTKSNYDPHNMVFVNKRADALQLLKSREFDVIVSDFNMPEMDYVQFRESALKLTELKYKKKIWILLASGNLGEVHESKAIADMYMAKPFEIEKLCEFVDALAVKAKKERRQDEV